MNTTSDVAVEVSHITKQFTLAGSTRSLKAAIIDRIRNRNQFKKFTALSDVSFQLKKGETLGIIGHNGAGKSTLLSIIARTMSPTSGTVHTQGTISSLLELGAGFHPDLTGRENVMLYGSIMGIPRETMHQRFDEIVEFSGLKEFIDQPVRFYSSGMYVRLGFSVAVQVDPDILLVDEVLAVGDSEFQRRCLEKMDEFRRAGKSMILITHDIGTVQRVADRIAYLSHGKLLGLGKPEEMAQRYEQDTTRAAVGISIDPTADADEVPPRLVPRRRDWGTREVSLTKIEFLDLATDSATKGVFRQEADFARIRVHYHAPERIENPVFGFSLESLDTGYPVFSTNTHVSGITIPEISGSGSIDFTIDLRTLQAGDYAVSFLVDNADHTQNFHHREGYLWLQHTKRLPNEGICALPVTWNVK